jgi:hypothetical protein
VRRTHPETTQARQLPGLVSLLVATLVSRLAKQLSVLLLGHALAALLDD